MKEFQKELTRKIIAFRDERNWAQFHSSKDLAMCLSIEANEVLELFLWKNEDEVDLSKLSHELGDVFYSILLLAEKFDIDIVKAFNNKLEETKKKYPIEKFAGTNKKYNEVNV